MSPIHRINLCNISFVLLLILFTGSFSSSVLAMNNPCDPEYVGVDENGDFFVLSSMDITGVTDTTNLQCVNDAIENQPFDAVRLRNGTFNIKGIALNCPPSKHCTFTGTTRTGTILNLVDKSIDCKGNLAGNVVAGGLNFRGNITVQFLTIRGNAPCMDDGMLPGLIVFTGAPAVLGSTCGNSVLFGTLNRVEVTAQGHEIDSGVLVYPQGRYLGDAVCQDGLSGSFTSTRTSIDGSFFGLTLSMQSGARVGLDFLESTNSVVGIAVFNSNAITAINFCTISGTATSEFDYFGVSVSRFAGSPKTTTTNISKCTFNIESEPGADSAIGINIRDFSPPSSMPAVVSANTFKQTGPRTFGVSFTDVSNCTITGNRFTGDGGNAMALFSETVPVRGCTITANTGLPEFTSAFDPIFASEGTFDNVLGPHPGAFILDSGCNFNLNDPSGGCAIAGGSPLKSDASTNTPLSTSAWLTKPRQVRTTGFGAWQLRQSMQKHKTKPVTEANNFRFLQTQIPQAPGQDDRN